MGKIELKPCPFCGGKALLLQCNSKTWSAECLELSNDWCGAEVYGSTAEEAAEAWNTRNERTCHDVSKHGDDSFECSECGAKLACDDGYGNTLEFPGVTEYPTRPRYCPHCGAKVVS